MMRGKILRPVELGGAKTTAKKSTNNKSYTMDEIVQFTELLNRQKHDVGNVPAVQNMHGSGGLFSRSGVRPEMWSALPRARTLSRLIPFRRSPYEDKITEILTGQLETIGSNPESWCEVGVTAGKLKVCQQITPFGQLKISTDKITLQNAGLRRDYADTPRRLLNSGQADNRFVPEALASMPLDTEDIKAVTLYRTGVAIERAIGKVEFAGVTTKTPAQAVKGFIREYRGIEGLVKTGYTDAVEGITCPAADSVVINFNDNIGETMSDARNIVEAVTDMYVALLDRARQVGINAEWVIAMHPFMFYAMVDAWACNYATSRCEFTSGNNNRLVVDGNGVNQMRIDMLNGQYLLINGVAVPVVLCDGIADGSNGGNSYTQDMFMLPLTANGEEVLYYDYLDMGNEVVQSILRDNFNTPYVVINDGLYGVSQSFTEGCLSWSFHAQVRLMLDTPFLAGRVDNVTFQYLVNSRSPYPGQSLYDNGGVSIVS